MEKLRVIKRSIVALLVICCVGVLLALFLVVWGRPVSSGPETPAVLSFVERVDQAIDRGFERLESGIRLTDADKRFLLRAARSVLENEFSAGRREVTSADWPDVPPNVASQTAKLFVTLIAGGKVRGCQSGSAGHLLDRAVEATRRAIADARFGGALRRDELSDTRVDITLLLEPKDVMVRDPRLIDKDIEVGIHALSLERGERGAFFKSSVPVAHGYDLRKTLQRLGIKAGLGPNGYRGRATRFRKYVTVHFTESPVDRSLVNVYRYNLLKRQSEVTRDAHVEALRLCGNYMVNHVDEDGVLTYRYDVYRDKRENSEKPGALVRRLASTWALAMLGTHFKEDAYTAAAKKSIDCMLKRYYRRDAEKGFGYLQVGPDANLAMASFALLCLVEIGHEHFHAEEAKGLTAFILAMEDKERGFLYPTYLPDKLTEFERKEAYYPGEALTALMTLYVRTKDPECLAVTERVFDYYRTLFDRTRKKASLTPWMSKAYTAAFLATGKRKYAEFVFKMNDRLLEGQEGPDAKYVDRIGSFYTSGASAPAGVFTESLVEAYRLAKAQKDAGRMKAYREGILLGNRFLLQCQYRPENMFTAPNPDLALGGIRAAVHNSSVQIDCVQHAACALLKTLQHVF